MEKLGRGEGMTMSKIVEINKKYDLEVLYQLPNTIPIERKTDSE